MNVRPYIGHHDAPAPLAATNALQVNPQFAGKFSNRRRGGNLRLRSGRGLFGFLDGFGLALVRGERLGLRGLWRCVGGFVCRGFESTSAGVDRKEDLADGNLIAFLDADFGHQTGGGGRYRRNGLFVFEFEDRLAFPDLVPLLHQEVDHHAGIGPFAQFRELHVHRVSKDRKR